MGEKENTQFRGLPIRILAWPAFDNRIGNPYNSLLYSQIIKQGNVVTEYKLLKIFEHSDIWHIHWPDVYLGKRPFLKMWIKSQFFLWAVKLMRRKGTKIIWTAHNLTSHENYYPKFEERYWDQFFKNIDGWISLTETGKNLAVKRFPQLISKPHCVIPHGHYRDVYENSLSADVCRDRLGLSPQKGPVMLYFGLIRPYKNIPDLIKAFRQITHKEATLIVAGKANDAEILKAIKHTAEGASQVRLFLKFIPPEDAQLYFNAADLVVLPFREVLNSGSALMSLSFNKPILVPDMGSMKELQSSVGKEWVRTYDGNITPAILDNEIKNFHPPIGNAPLAAFEWDLIGQKTADFYREVLFTKNPSCKIPEQQH